MIRPGIQRALCTLGDLAARKQAKPGANKGRAIKDGVSAACAKGVHSGCYSLTCKCSCKHGGERKQR